MHHLIYPSKDTYITNENNYLEKNLGIDEILEIKANTQLYRVVSIYQSASISQSYTSLVDLYRFTGNIDGYLSGSLESSSLYVNSDADINSLYYTFSGSITGSINGTTTTSSVSAQSGHLSGSLTGIISGSWSGIICDASGSVNIFTGEMQGIATGTSSVYSPITSFENIPSLSRAMLKFDISTISKSIADGSIENTSSLKFFLKLTAIESSEIPLTYSMYAYPISQSWEMGNGYYETGGSDLGTSWYYKNFSGDSGSYWYNIEEESSYQFVDYLNTASYASESFLKGGGTWHYAVPNDYISSSGYCSTISASQRLVMRQDFNYEKTDINIDVSDIVKSWICGCIPNEGLILVSSLELSQANTTSGTFKFFSKDTNTIYTPCLDVSWDDSIYTTGSLTSVTDNIPFTLIAKNVNKNYKFGAIPRIDVYARPKNPLKNFVKNYQMNQYLTSSLLPSSSYYSIKDNESEKVILDFDESTKLSCDGNLHYFILDTTSFAQERFYRILFKVVTENQEQIFDNDYIFKITR